MLHKRMRITYMCISSQLDRLHILFNKMYFMQLTSQHPFIDLTLVMNKVVLLFLIWEKSGKFIVFKKKEKSI